MKPNLLEYYSYRQYLKDVLESQGPKSGLKRRASEALQVHTTFISQVVLGRADLSLDQGERMNMFLQHSEEESEVFLDLIIYERASEPKLKSRFEQKIQKRQQARMQINKRLESTSELNEVDQERFYSSHLYGLLHVLPSLPEYRTVAKLSGVTGFSSETVSDAIDFLIKTEVLKVVHGTIVPGKKHLHLGNDSKQIWRHHANWRMAALQSMTFQNRSDLHYSLVFSCSRRDANKLKEFLLAQLKSMSNTIGSSSDEAVYSYCFDFFAIVG